MIIETVTCRSVYWRFEMRNERGSTLLEFAFVCVVFFMIIFGIIDFGRAMYTYHFVADAAREATRYAMVRGNACTGLPDCNADQAAIQDYVRGITPGGIDKSQVAVAANWPPEDDRSPVCTTNQKNPGCFVRVRVTYPFRFSLPFMPVGPLNMQSQSEMLISQ